MMTKQWYGTKALAAVAVAALNEEPGPREASRATTHGPPKAADMSVNEWSAFWGAVECCMQLQNAYNSNGEENRDLHKGVVDHESVRGKRIFAATEASNCYSITGSSSAKRARLARCGNCAGCRRGDCGTCKNCLDKPKYGGRGIKKQACLRRACLNVTQHDGADSKGHWSDERAEANQIDLDLSAEGSHSDEASPALGPHNLPCDTAHAPPPLDLLATVLSSP